MLTEARCLQYRRQRWNVTKYCTLLKYKIKVLYLNFYILYSFILVLNCIAGANIVLLLRNFICLTNLVTNYNQTC